MLDFCIYLLYRAGTAIASLLPVRVLFAIGSFLGLGGWLLMVPYRRLARRNLEILMLHDPANVDGVAIHMQIMNTTRAKTRSRDMGRAYKLSEVLPRVKVPLTGIWGEFDSTTYPHIQERIDLFRALQPDFQMNVIPGAGHWVAYEAADAFNKKLIDVLTR